MIKLFKKLCVIALVGAMTFALVACGGANSGLSTEEEDKIIQDLIDAKVCVNAKSDDMFGNVVWIKNDKEYITLTDSKNESNGKTIYDFKYEEKDDILERSFTFRVVGTEKEGKFIPDEGAKIVAEKVTGEINKDVTNEQILGCIYKYLNQMTPQTSGDTERSFIPIASEENTKVTILDSQFKEAKNQKRLEINIEYDHKDDTVTSKGSFRMIIFRNDKCFPDVMSETSGFKITEEACRDFSNEEIKASIRPGSTISIPEIITYNNRKISDKELNSIVINGSVKEGRKGIATGTIVLDGETAAKNIQVLYTIDRNNDRTAYYTKLDSHGIIVE